MLGVDVGGTFTDVVSVKNGQIRTVKVATDVENTERGVLEGARLAGVENAAAFHHASTQGLNAIITRRLPKIGFLTTGGHRDILDAGRAWRPVEGLTDASWRRSFGDAARPLVPRYLRRGVKERITADGSILIQLDEDDVREQLRVLNECGVQGVAVCLLNAYVNPEHEARVLMLIQEELGDVAVSISSDVSPLAKEYARASTTVVDVFMKLIYGEYSKRLDRGLKDLGFNGSMAFADCAAQLVRHDIAMEHPFRIVFAGPAAGTVSSAHFGNFIGVSEMLCCDVGGTSSDISLVTGGKPFVNTTFELEHDLIVNALSNEISSIGAGGGSLVAVTAAGELTVGPGSAGANPGPACYGKGGTEPTVTDAALLIGIIDPDGFAGGQMRLDKELALAVFERLDSPLPLEQRIRYAFNVGVNNIAEGVLNIAIHHGADPRDHSLMAFGAAGPMLLPAALDQVHAVEVIVPPHPGLFSALGLVSSDLVYADSRSAYTLLTSESANAVAKVYNEMERGLRDRLSAEDLERAEFVRTFDGRLLGQTWETPFVSVPDGEIAAEGIKQMIANFHEVYEERTGNRFDALPVQGVTFRMHAVVPAEKVEYQELPGRTDGSTPTPKRMLILQYLTDDDQEVAEYDREDLRSGDTFEGPAIVREALSTTFILARQTARVGNYGDLRITAS